jgi:hypothetical protein
MTYTDKQERNGATGSAGEQDSARTGPVPVVAPLVGQAEAAAADHMTDGHALTDVLAGHAVSFEWDAGLAVSEVAGES